MRARPTLQPPFPPPVAVLLLLAVGCGGDTTLREGIDTADPVDAVPLLEPSPASFDAGSLHPWEFRETVVTLWNRGTGVLRIESVAIEGSAAWTIDAVGALPAILAPESRLPVALRLAPDGAVDLGAELVVTTNEAEQPETRVPLAAVGRLPAVEVTPPAVDFGEQLLGCERWQELIITNVGDSPLTVGELSLVDSPPGLLVDNPPAGAVLEPAESYVVDVRWYATDLVGFQTAFEVTSDDPFVPLVTVPTLGVVRPEIGGWDDHVFEAGGSDADILFVVDNSCSMGDEQASLGGAFEDFVEGLEATGSDYRLAATTTDIADGGALVGSPTIVSPATPNPASTFASNVNLGTWGSGWEQGFEPAVMALQGLSGAADFLRPGARLNVVFVSDEPEQSAGAVMDWVGAIQALAPSDTILSAISGGTTGCSGAGGSASAAPRYQQAVNGTGGVALSICDPDWGANLELLSEVATGATTVFPLSATPRAESVNLLVDGAAWPVDRWTYRSDSNTVRLVEPHPADGAELRITYIIDEGCEG